MRTSVWALAVIALATTTACSNPKGDDFTTSDAANIRQKSQEFVDAFNSKQVPKILAEYADNSVFMARRRGRRPGRRGADCASNIESS